MKFRNLAASAVALAVSSSPVLAQAVSRVGTASADATTSQMGGDSSLLLILAVILIGAGIFVLAGNNSDTPSSP